MAAIYKPVKLKIIHVIGFLKEDKFDFIPKLRKLLLVFIINENNN